MRRSLMSGRPRLLHSCLHDANTSFSSRGKTLQKKKKKTSRNPKLFGMLSNLSNSQRDFERCNTSTVVKCLGFQNVYEVLKHVYCFKII